MTRKSVWVAGWAVSVMVATVLLLVGVASKANAQQATPAAPEVKIDNFSFAPETLTVPVGTTITWTNRDDIPHTVVSTDGVFKSKVRDTDEKFSYTFAKAGTYSYYCSLHPKMTGKIVVQ
jgi:plastocyanin